jgi:hypothetical protein
MPVQRKWLKRAETAIVPGVKIQSKSGQLAYIAAQAAYRRETCHAAGPLNTD